MKHLFLVVLLLVNFIIKAQTEQSPSKSVQLEFKLNSNGNPYYSVNYKSKNVIKQSFLGLKCKDGSDLVSNFSIDSIGHKTVNEDWQPVLGEQSNIKNNYNEMIVALSQKASGRNINIIFRVFDEGIAFRYDFPKQNKLNYFIISDEVSEFNLTGNHKVFWLPGDFDTNEYNYEETLFSEINTDKVNLNNGIGFKAITKKFAVQTPMMMKSSNGIYLNIFEAAVVNYPVMQLDVDVQNYKLKSSLAPNALGDKAYLQTPCVSPWRTIMVSDDARDIVGSKMILNLNDSCKLEDTSWIKPMKYVGIWWEMHIGKSTWDYAGSQNAQNNGDLKPTGKH
jgi:hypothetical protein